MLKPLILCILLSMAPISELRGALIYGMVQEIPLGLLFPVCVAANLIPVPFIILLMRKILDFMQSRGGVIKKAADWLIERGEKKSATVKRNELLGMFLLVAIPLPGTGVWTAGLVAALLRRRVRDSIVSIGAGVIVAGILVILMSKGVIHVAGLI